MMSRHQQHHRTRQRTNLGIPGGKQLPPHETGCAEGYEYGSGTRHGGITGGYSSTLVGGKIGPPALLRTRTPSDNRAGKFVTPAELKDSKEPTKLAPQELEEMLKLWIAQKCDTIICGSDDKAVGRKMMIAICQKSIKEEAMASATGSPIAVEQQRLEEALMKDNKGADVKKTKWEKCKGNPVSLEKHRKRNAKNARKRRARVAQEREGSAFYKNLGTMAEPDTHLVATRGAPAASLGNLLDVSSDEEGTAAPQILG